VLDENVGFEHIVALTAIGPRVAGSPAERAAGRFLVGKFEDYGLKAEIRPFPIRVWEQKAAVIDANGRSIACTGVSFTGSGMTQARELETVYVERATEFDLKRAGVLHGKALLIARDVYQDYPDTALFERLREFEPGAVIFTASPGHHGVPVVFYNFKDCGRVSAPPCFVVAHSDMTALVANGPARISLQLDGSSADGQSENVIGILEGEAADEVVVVSAHHDTVPGSPGATDNAGGCAVVLELARVFAARGKPKRTIHFCSWGSHETGMHGSEAYLSSLRRSGSKVVAMINYDCIGMTIGDDQVDILGGQGWIEFMDAAIARTGISPLLRHGPGFTDFTNFGAAGIPSVNIQQSYLNYNHTPDDSIDKCSPIGLIKPLALGSVILEAVLDAEDYRPDFDAALLDEVRMFNSRWGWSQFDESAVLEP